MRTLLLFVILLSAFLVEFHTVLQDGSFLRYLDTHPNPRVVPQIEYTMGSGYELFHDLQQASTYYIRIPIHYPNSPMADDAYWEYLTTLDGFVTDRAYLIQEYGKYVELFPKGEHIDNAQGRILSIQSNSSSRY